MLSDLRKKAVEILQMISRFKRFNSRAVYTTENNIIISFLANDELAGDVCFARNFH